MPAPDLSHVVGIEGLGEGRVGHVVVDAVVDVVALARSSLGFMSASGLHAGEAWEEK